MNSTDSISTSATGGSRKSYLYYLQFVAGMGGLLARINYCNETSKD